MIHPTALISSDVDLGQGVEVGPFAVIEGPGRIGDESIIEGHAVLKPYVYLGQRNRVHSTAVLGGLPQDLSFHPAMVTRLEIGDDNIFREGVTISRATREGEATRIGSGNYFMNHSHLGHDGVMGDHNILASGATLGGHTEVGDRVFFGGGAMVHQFCRIGSYAILQGLAGINKDVMPFALVGGRPGKHYRLNLIGLRRAGIEGDRLKAVSAAFRRLRARQDLEGLPDTEELKYLRAFLASSSRRGGLLGFIDVATRDGDLRTR
ncbi:MAG: acyl-ACP--UDP-N-acetylglucosamine O-acyltransferase [Methylococcus sp.]|jgi:UDP-N-acetylglucosamine acyltransferase